MHGDDANQAASGQPIHTQPIEAPYEPVPGVPGTTLEEQFHAGARMIESGDLTTNQGRAIVRRLADRFPEANHDAIRAMHESLARVFATVVEGMTDADRACWVWRLTHCGCAECGVIQAALAPIVNPDGTLTDHPVIEHVDPGADAG